MTGPPSARIFGLGLAVLFALLDLAAPVGAPPGGARRLLRALPAGVLAVTLRLADAPPLLAVALLAFAASDALGLDDADRRGVGAGTTTLLAQLLLVAAVWELAAPALLLRAPWRMGAGLLVLSAGAGVLWRRPAAGPLKALAPGSALLLAVAAAGAGAQGSVGLTLAFVTAAVLWSVAAGAALWRPGVPARWERALRSAAPLALAWPLLPPR